MSAADVEWGIPKSEDRDIMTGNAKFINLDPKEGFDWEGVEGLKLVVGGDQFDYRIPYDIARQAPLPPNPADHGLFESPFKIHKDLGLRLSSGVFKADCGTSGRYVNINCLGCHSSQVGGQIIGGGYNKDFDPLYTIAGTDMALSYDFLVFRSRNPGQIANWKHFKKFYQRLLRPVLSRAITVGDNQGQYISVAYVPFIRDPKVSLEHTLGGEEQVGQTLFETKVICPNCPPLVPVHSHPWWLSKHKKNHYWYGDSDPSNPGQEAEDFVVNFGVPFHDLNASGLPTDNTQYTPWAKRVANQQYIFKYIKQTVSPVHPHVSLAARGMPGVIDKELVKKGRSFVNGQYCQTMPGWTDEQKANCTSPACGDCHGTYQPSGKGYKIFYKTLSGDRKYFVDTDVTYLKTMAAFKVIADTLNEYKKNHNGQGPEYNLVKQTANGPDLRYVAPPLDGVWASAPYFHNGSVPTLMSVLDPQMRPKYWTRTGGAQGYRYDNEKLGLPYEELGSAPPATPGVASSSYNTMLPGYSNRGHIMTEKYSNADRVAIIEFLKCLGGPHIVSAESAGEPLEPVAAGHPCEDPSPPTP